MATLNVTGTVTRLFFGDKGAEISETIQTKNGPIVKKYVAWLSAPATFREGDTITASGEMSAKIDNWTNPDGSAKLNREGLPGQSVKVELNNVTVTKASVLESSPF